MTNKKQIIQHTIHTIPLCTYYSNPLSRFIRQLTDVLAEYPTCEYFLKEEETHDNEDAHYLVLATTRLETEEEYENRLRKEEDNGKVAFEYAKKTYFSLKDKYEPTP